MGDKTERALIQRAFGERVASLRRLKGITQSEMGSRFSPAVEKQRIWALEKGRTLASVADVIQIHGALRLKGEPGDLINHLLDPDKSPFVS